MKPNDYVFRYSINPAECAKLSGNDIVTHLAGNFLKKMLDLVIPCTDGKELKVDGFKLLCDRTTVHDLFKGEHQVTKDDIPVKGIVEGFQDPKNVCMFNPVLDMIRDYLEKIFSLVDPECGGNLVKIDGFRLKSLGQWLVPSSGDPSEIIEHAGTRCNCDCVFCYNKGAPPSLALQSPVRSAREEYNEIKARIKYYNPKAKRCFFPGLGSTCEVLAHPYAMKILRSVREKTDAPFRIATNGSALTADNISKLAELEPVYLDVSLNSSNAIRRKKLMRDSRPEIAINSLPLLKSAGISYSVVIVPWPIETETEMLDDLEKTISCAAANDARMVQVSLPGYTQYFSTTKVFDRESLWPALVQKIRDIRRGYECPVVVMPGIYEEYLYRIQKNVPEVIGVVKNSPAYMAGIKPGDIVRGIAGTVVRSRYQCRYLLSVLQGGSALPVTLKVLRGGKELEFCVNPNRHAYPYSKCTESHLGFVFMGTGLPDGYLEKLEDIFRSREAQRVLFLSSALVKPTFMQMLKKSSFMSGIDLEVEVPPNRFFGGNIFMGDLLVVEDFISFIKEYTASKGVKPDLTVIPSSPFNISRWGRDLTGRCWLDIERETGVAVELLECGTIYD